ncbi:hypothetical protein TraAM80_07637 [Trypanosoma rangeli]|uniref:EF-hand domain-containing protein n=1 Tax=Trypanosoma rangeli TaxID=5698 RepID=A0A422N4H8_TRYRA|nr:uncharacterized protein TraAM80_07637 [Trypanosoma rangeli]RNF00379.1 hypothetical protein TraAM80_07637 [Trypanosoma rangeli]|eukprot:RNF00379.1 hypothetical protein TraAM80_07637 [Trypanosoma rangeli]
MTVLSAFKAKSTRFKAVVERVRRLLHTGASGANGIRALSRSLGIAVDAGGNLVDKATFVECLKQNGVALDENDVEAVMSVLDRNGDGTLDPVDFIAALRRDLTPVKSAWVARVWYTFRQNADGTICIEDLVNAFNAAGHPAVVRGERSEEKVREEFQLTFNTTTNPEGVLSRQEFEQYYSCVAGSCLDDASFLTLVRGVWPALADDAARNIELISNKENQCNSTFIASQSALQKSTVNKLRQNAADLDTLIRTLHRPAVMDLPLAVRLLSLSLRGRDVEGTFFLTRGAFTEALWQQRLYISRPDELLPVLDTKGDGSVDYLLYLTMLLPSLPPARRMMLERLWELFLKDTCGAVDVLELHRQFQAKDGEEKNAFLSAWDVRRAIRRRLTLEELVEWYVPMSYKIQLDNDFGAMLKRQWNLM